MGRTREKRRYVYISGPITGDPYYKSRFTKAERLLMSMGYEVVNPARLDYYLPTSATWEDYMKLAFASIELCDTMYMLAKWEMSPGATAEKKLAEDLGLDIIYQEVCGDEDG